MYVSDFAISLLFTDARGTSDFHKEFAFSYSHKRRERARRSERGRGRERKCTSVYYAPSLLENLLYSGIREINKLRVPSRFERHGD